MTKPHRIERLYAWIAVHPDGEHGIPAVMVDGVLIPLIGSDLEHIESLRRAALSCLDRPDIIGVELVEFAGRSVLETH